MILSTWLVLNSLGFIANGIYTLDNRRPVLPFDYAGQGLAGDNYVEGGYAREDYIGEKYYEGYYSFVC